MAAALVGACLAEIAYGGIPGLTLPQLTASITRHHAASADDQLVDAAYVAYVWRLLAAEGARAATIAPEASAQDALPPVAMLPSEPFVSLPDLECEHGGRLRIVLEPDEVYARLTSPGPAPPLTLSPDNYRCLQLIARAGPGGIFLTQIAEQAGFSAKKAYSQLKSLINQSFATKFSTPIRPDGPLAPLAVYAPWAEAFARSLQGAEDEARARARQLRASSSAVSPSPQDADEDEAMAEIRTWIQDPESIAVPPPVKTYKRLPSRRTKVKAEPNGSPGLDASTVRADDAVHEGDEESDALPDGWGQTTTVPGPDVSAAEYFSYPQLVPDEGSRLMHNSLVTQLRLLKLCAHSPNGVVERFRVLHRLGYNRVTREVQGIFTRNIDRLQARGLVTPALSQRKIRCLQITDAGREAIPDMVQQILATEEEEAATLAGQLHLALTPGFPREGGLDAHILRLAGERPGGMTAQALLLALGIAHTRPMQRSFADLLTQMVDTGALKVTMRQEKRAFVQYFEPTHTSRPLVAQGEVLLDRPPDKQDMLSLVQAGYVARTKRSNSRAGRDDESEVGETSGTGAGGGTQNPRSPAKPKKFVNVDENGRPIRGRPRKYPRDENGKPIKPGKNGPGKGRKPRKGQATVPEASVGDASGYIGDISVVPQETDGDAQAVDTPMGPAASLFGPGDDTVTCFTVDDTGRKRGRSPNDEGTLTPAPATRRPVLLDPAPPDVGSLAPKQRLSTRLSAAASPTPPVKSPTREVPPVSVPVPSPIPLVHAATMVMSQSNAHMSTQARKTPQRRSLAHGSSNVPPADGDAAVRGGRWQVAAKRESMLIEAIKEQGGILDTVQLNAAFAEVVGRQEDEDVRGMSMSDLKTRKTAISSLERQKRLQSTKVMTLAGNQRTVVFLPDIDPKTKGDFIATLCATGRPPKIDDTPAGTTDVAVQRTISVRVNSRRRAAVEEQDIRDPDELLERWAESVRTGTAELHHSLGLIPGTMARLQSAYEAIRTVVASHADGSLEDYDFNLDEVWLEFPFVRLMQIMPPNYFGDAYRAKQYVENERFRTIPIGQLPKEVKDTFVNTGRVRQVLFNLVRTLRSLGLARPVQTVEQETADSAAASNGEQAGDGRAPDGHEVVPGPTVQASRRSHAKKHTLKPTVVWRLVVRSVPMYDWARAWDKDLLPKQTCTVDLLTDGDATAYWSKMEQESLSPFCRPAEAAPQAPNPHARSHLVDNNGAGSQLNLLPLTVKPEAVGRDDLGAPRVANKSFPRFHSQSWRRGYFMIERQLGRVRQFRDLVGASRLESDPERLQGLADAIGAPVWVVVNYVSRLAQLEEVAAEKERMKSRRRRKRKRQRRDGEELEEDELEEEETEEEEQMSDSEPLQRHVWADQAAADRRALRVRVGMKASEARRNKFNWFDARLDEYIERYPAAEEERAFLINHLRPHRAAWAAGHVDLTPVETRAMIRLTVQKTAESAVRRRGRVAVPKNQREPKGAKRVDAYGRVRFTRAKRAGLLKTDLEYQWTPEIEDVLRDCVAILRARDHVRGGKSSWVALAQIFTDLKHPAPTCRRKVAAMLQHSMSERTYLDRLEQEWMVVWQKHAGTPDLPEADPASPVFDLRAHVLFLRRHIDKAKIRQMGVQPLLVSDLQMQEHYHPVTQPYVDTAFQMLFTGERAATTKGMREDLEWTPWVLPSAPETQQLAEPAEQLNRDQLLRSTIMMSLRQHKVLAQADLDLLSEGFSVDQVNAALSDLCADGLVLRDGHALPAGKADESALAESHDGAPVLPAGLRYKLAKDSVGLPDPPLSLSVWRQGQLELRSVEPGFQPLDLPDAQALALIESFAHGQAELDVDLSQIPDALTQISFSAKLLTDDKVELPVSYHPSAPAPAAPYSLEACPAPSTEVPPPVEPEDSQLVHHGVMGQTVDGLSPSDLKDTLTRHLGFTSGYDRERLIALSYAKQWTVDVAHLPRVPPAAGEGSKAIIPARWMALGTPNEEVWRAALSAVAAWLTFRPSVPLTQLVKTFTPALDGVELRFLLASAARAGAIRLSPISTPAEKLDWEHARVLPLTDVAVEAQLFSSTA